MGAERAPAPAQLVIAALAADPDVTAEAVLRLQSVLGPIEPVGEPVAFDWTDYYAREMGAGLSRSFFAAERLVRRDLLADVKLLTNRIECALAIAGRRRVNLDPGLLTLEAFVLASTKGQPQRIYLRDGIYAEAVLWFQDGAYRPHPRTYPEFLAAGVCALLGDLRRQYQRALEARRSTHCDPAVWAKMGGVTVKSMTGFGRAEGVVGGQHVSIEVRTVNHRYLDVRLTVPRTWLSLEMDIERAIRERFARGRIECVVRGSSAENAEPVLDEHRMRQVYDAYVRMAHALGLSDRPSLELIARAEGVLTLVPAGQVPEEVCPEMLSLVGRALEACDSMRKTEGQRLRSEFEARLTGLKDCAAEIRKVLPAETRAIEERMAERVRQLAGQVEVSEDRLVQELAILAERSDVTEELERFEGHVAHLAELIARGGSVGREGDFLCQELNREINTLCSKIHSQAIVRLAVAARAEVERVREQIQNVE